MTNLLKTAMIKLLYAFAASPLFATFALFVTPIRTMLDGEKEFIALLTVALLIDLLVGAMKYLKLHQFSFKDMLFGLIIKVVVAYGGVMLFLMFASLDDGWVAEWFTLVSKFTILLYPAGSALSNMYILTEKKFPPIGFMKRLKSFEEIVVTSEQLLHNDVKEDKS